MKRIVLSMTVVGGLLCCGGAVAHGQGTFQNLDFELAQLVPVSGNTNGPFQFSAALPGWTGYIDGQVQTTVVRNYLPLGYPFPAFISINDGAFLGHYYVSFGAGTAPGSGGLVPAAIAQAGEVPVGARTMLYTATSAAVVSFDGLEVPSVSMVTYSYAVDVSNFAGKTMELRFQASAAVLFENLDDIRFSDVAIPEPGIASLVTLGVALFSVRLWRNSA